ncbi:hypothetical protein Tco_0776004, partial [Tanacetum coccineum]
AWCFEEQSTQLDVRIADVRRHMDTDLYLHMLTAIAGRRWVLSHGAYDPDVESKYVAAVNDFENVSFSLLEELEALKDSPLALIMSDLTLDGDADCHTPPRQNRKA